MFQIDAEDDTFADLIRQVGFEPDRADEARYVLILRTFMDDSGKKADDLIVTAAAFAFRANAYARFEHEWKQALDDFGLSKAKGGPGYFHMVDFAANQPPHYGWPEHLRRARLNILLQLIIDNAARVASTWVPVITYTGLMSPKSDKRLGGPFGLAAVNCFLLLGGWLRQYSEAQAAIVLEDGSEGIYQVEQVYKILKNDHQVKGYSRLYSFTKAGKEVPGLQAADILAYEMQRRGVSMMGGDPRAMRPYVLKRLAEVPGSMSLIDPTNMRRWSEMFEVDFRGSKLDRERGLITWPDGRIEPISKYIKGRQSTPEEAKAWALRIGELWG